MAPSATSTSISTFLMSHGTLLVLEPRRQTNADLKSANEVLVLIHEMVLVLVLVFNNNNNNNNNNNKGFKPMCRIIIINVAAQDQAIKTKHYRNKILKIV